MFATGYALFHFYTAGFGSFPNLIQRSLHVGFALALAFILYASHERRRKAVPWLDWVFVAISLISPLWVTWNYDRFMARLGANTWDLILGTLTVILLMEAARRVIGWVFTLLAALFIGYAFLGPWLPMPFTHRGLSFHSVINQLYLTDLGLWGTTTHITATVVAIFIIFGAVIVVTGGGKTFMDLALLVAGRSVGGPAKVATVASGLFGTVSGTAAANVAVTGTFTIPLMKRQGYASSFAAAVEATASSGGQLMPPIMGAGAFIMAELLGVPYVNVMLAALVPSLLFYAGVFMAVHYESKKRGYAPVPESEMPRARDVFSLRQFGPFILPILGLIVMLLRGSTPQKAGFTAVVIAMVLFVLSDWQAAHIVARLKALIRGFESAGYGLVMIAVLAGTAQIIIGMIGVTGFGVRLSALLIAASGGIMIVGLLLAMAVALVLGMGMPTTAAYLLAAAVLGPSLTNMGVAALPAHLFIFYFAIISAITPPVCTAVFVAAAIARTRWLEVAWVATRLGIVAFIIPYMFVYSPSLLLMGDRGVVALAALTAFVGVCGLAGAAMGYFVRENRPLETVLLLIGALLLIRPGLVTDIIGLGLVAATALWQRASMRKLPSDSGLTASPADPLS